MNTEKVNNTAAGAGAIELAIGRIAWAYVFYYLDINLGSINLLPEWAAYALILSALPGLAAAERSAALLRPLAWLLLTLDAAEWAAGIFGADPTGSVFYLVNTLARVISLYFHFQLLTNVAAIADGIDSQRAAGIRRLRNVCVIFNTMLAIPWPAERLGNVLQGVIGFGFAIIACVIIIWSLSVLFGLRRALRGEAPRG